MKKVILLFFSLFIVLMLMKAQSNFRPGYIITNEKDTISGLIDFRTHKMNAQMCRFRLTDMSGEKIYYPGEIYGYRFTDDGKYYVSNNIEIEDKQEKVFLEYLIQGMISLYFYPGEEYDCYFFQDESGKMIPVTKRQGKEIVDNITGARYISEDNRYEGIVRHIFKDSESISKAQGRIPFTQDKMIDLTKRYHAEMCTTGEKCIEFQAKPDKYTKIIVSVYAGMQIQTYKIRSWYYHSGHDINPSLIPVISSLAPEIGAQINFSIPRRNKSISLQADVSLAGFKDKQELRLTISEAQHYSRLEVDGLVTSVKLGGKYTYHKGLVRPLIEGGFMMNNMFVSSNCTFSYDKIYYIEDFVIDDFLMSPCTIFGFYIGTGLDYHLNKENALLFRIVYDDGRRPYGMLSQTLREGEKMSTWQFKLGYTF